MGTSNSRVLISSAPVGERSGRPLAAGLLLVLQQATVARLVFSAMAIALSLAAPGQMHRLALAYVVLLEKALLLILVTVPGPRRRLRQSFLPLVLGWLLVVPFVEVALAYPYLQGARIVQMILPLGSERMGGSALIWLVVPVALAAWQYERWGLYVSLATSLAGHIALGAAVWSGLPVAGNYVLEASARMATLALLGYIIAHLATAQRAEHAALEQANRALALRASTAAQLAESRERNRLARDLHDTLAHSLTGLSIQLQALGILLDHDPAAVRAELQSAQTAARTGAQEARRAIQALRATPLEDLGLPESLRRLCRGQAERTGVAIDFTIEEVAGLDPVAEQAVYRIAEGALSNVERHAAASQVAVSFRQEKSDCRLTVRDDGLGFDPSAVAADRYGLAGMREHAAAVGGRLAVESRPGQGATVILDLPLTNDGVT